MTVFQMTTMLCLFAVSSTHGHSMFRHSDVVGNDYTVSQLTSGNFTVGSVNMINSDNTTTWSPGCNAIVTISGHTKKLIEAGTFKYQLYETGVTSFIASGNSPYVTCDNKRCDTSSPIALQWFSRMERGNNFKLTMSIALPAKKSSSSEFKLVLWGEDQDHFPYDFTTTVNFKYGAETAAAAIDDADEDEKITSEPKSCKNELKKKCGHCHFRKKCWLSCAKSNEADLIAHGCTKPSTAEDEDEETSVDRTEDETINKEELEAFVVHQTNSPDNHHCEEVRRLTFVV
jgi:hypothetical protein